MARWDLTGKRPDWFSKEQQRYIVGTNEGWVFERRYVTEMGNHRIHREVLVTADGLANSTYLGAPTIAEIYVANSTGGEGHFEAGDDLYVGVVYDEPLVGDPTGWTLEVTNLDDGTTITATANSTKLYANNVLVFQFTTANSGTYKIEGQTIANSSADVKSANIENENVELLISDSVSNTFGEFEIV